MCGAPLTGRPHHAITHPGSLPSRPALTSAHLSVVVRARQKSTPPFRLGPSARPSSSQEQPLQIAASSSEQRKEIEGVMGRGRAAAALLLAVAACLAALPATTTANKISINWKPNVNYSDWIQQHRPFYKGDWLVFYYTPGQADVVQVDEQGYNKCDSSNAIYNYSKGRSFAFELNETKTYYFICSYGYCYGGMRLAIKAEKLPPPSPPPAADRSGAFAAAFARAHAPVLAAAVAVLAVLLRMV